MTRSAESRTFHIRMSERRLRFAPDELRLAPRRPGVYELMACGAGARPEVLYVGLALPGDPFRTVYEALAAHMMGYLRPSKEDLSRSGGELYFDFVEEADAAGPEDCKDLAGALIERHKPRLNPSTPPPSSGRYSAVNLESD